jgi:CO/xanthine dehydrogenase FAD-binding subunit
MLAQPEFHRATSLAQALALLAEPGPTPTLLAGGTDVMVWIQAGAFRPERVIDIWGVRPECAGIGDDGDAIAIGALASYSEILASPLVKEHLPALWAASREVGAAQIQSRGTLGGNLGGSSPAGDTLPCLLAYDAEVTLASVAGTRQVPYAEFCTGYRATQRRPDEMITTVRFPKPAAAAVHGWHKAGTRLAQAISKTMLAGVGHLDDAGRVAQVRLGVGSVAPVPLRLDGVAAAVTGRVLDEDVLEEARRLAEAEIRPIDDVRSTADYRRVVTGNLVVRYLRELGGL